MKLRSLFPIFLALILGSAIFGCSTARKPEPTDAEREAAWREELEARRQVNAERQRVEEEEGEKLAAKVDVAKELLAWAKFYQDTLGVTVDFSKLQIPERKRGHHALIVVAKGVTADFLIVKCRLRFKTWNYPEKFNLLESVRNTNETYVVWLGWGGWYQGYGAATALCGEGGATLAEQLLYELKLFRETGQHPPFDPVVCGGSRSLGGDVPCVRWQDCAQELQIFMWGSMRY